MHSGANHSVEARRAIALIARGLLALIERTQHSDALAALHAFASGEPRSDEPSPSSFLYPPSLSRGLNLLILTCIRRGMSAPQSATDLLAWAQRPLASWNLGLPDEMAIDDDRLLDDDFFPTALCDELARSGDEDDLREQEFMEQVITACRNAGGDGQRAYVAFRRTLIERPVMTHVELTTTRMDPIMPPSLRALLDAAYQPAPQSAAQNGAWAPCRACGQLLLRTRRGAWTCETESCRDQGSPQIARTIPLCDEAVWLRRDLRRFIAAPGRAELRLADALRQIGATVELWPALDRYDLRVTFPNGAVWALDVKDWRNPWLLAQHVGRREFPTSPRWDRAWFVFPDERRRRHRYRETFQRACGALPKNVDADYEREILAIARRAVKENGHA